MMKPRRLIALGLVVLAGVGAFLLGQYEKTPKEREVAQPPVTYTWPESAWQRLPLAAQPKAAVRNQSRVTLADVARDWRISGRLDCRALGPGAEP